MRRLALCSVFFLLFQISFVRCSDSKETDQPVGRSYLTITQTLPVYESGGGEENLLFSTNEVWEIDFETEGNVAGDWYAAEPLSGDAGEKIAVTVTLSANEEYDPRTFTLVLSTATQEKRILVTQLERHAILLDDKTRYEVSFEEQTLTVRVRANVDYRVKVVEGTEWIAEAPQSRGLEQHTHTFRIARNGLDDPRTGRIVFEDTTSDLCDELTVVQAPWEDPDPERTSLNVFYKATGGASWTNRTNWGTDRPLGEWYGVETDDEGHVVSLRLPRNNLTGTIPAAIADLKYLRDLDLSWNALEGALTQIEGREVRSVLDDLTALETINLSHNRITGQQMPAKWGAMEHLRVVDLSSNLLQGDAFPAAWNGFFTNGRTVDLILNDNELTGEVPAVIQNHPDWSRLALQFIRQKKNNGIGHIFHNKDIDLPDFTYTNLKDGSQQQIRPVVGANKLTMLCNWDPTEEESLRFVEQVVRRFRTLYGAQGFEVVALAREGDRYREAAERYVQEHDVPWIAVTGCSDAQGRRVVLPDYPYPSYLFFDQRGILISDNFKDVGSFDHSVALNKTFDTFFGTNNCTYRSTDFSKDKQYVALQNATKGRGIDLILMGDGFTDVDIETGFYREVINFAMESFFTLEPVKSCRAYFNVYMVFAVSKERTVGESGKSKDTALGVKLYDGRPWFDYDTAFSRLSSYCNVCPLKSGAEYFPSVIVFGSDGGVTGMQRASIGPNCAFSGFTYSLQGTKGTFIHETVGHAFGLLADEYGGFDKITESRKYDLMYWQKDGRYLNVSLSSDKSEVYWSHLIGHPNYPYVGIYEGGYVYNEEVWRSEHDSMMRSTNYPYFNAISRELLYKRIMTLAGEEYSFERFVQNDLIKEPPYGIIDPWNKFTKTKYEDRHVPPIHLN